MKRLSPGQARVLQYLHQNAIDGECYRSVGQIAQAVELNRNSVTKATGRLIRLGIISREQMWEYRNDSDDDTPPSLLTAEQAQWISRSGRIKPGANRYKIHLELMETALEALRRTVIMSTCENLQFTLPFPPFEKTILASWARFTSQIQPVPISQDLRE